MNTPTPSRFRRFVAWSVMFAMTLTQTAQVAALTLATKPLAATTTSVVRPNLMYVLDDSGSMGWDYTPDYINDATVTDPTNAGIGPPGSSGDTGSVTRSGGSLSTITAVGGNLYYEQPAVVIEGGGGTGASATANWSSSTKKITSVTVNSGGSGYTSNPFVTFVGKLSSAAWGMCWGTTGTSNQGGTPKDTSAAPQCTTQSQMPYATTAVNYQYYDPSVRYEAPLKADGTRYANSVSTTASSDGFLGGTTKDLTSLYTHEVWCNSSTAAPSAADPTAAGKCRENLDSSSDNLYPNATFTFRKTYNGPAFYYTMGPSEYCTDDRYTNCVRSTAPTVVGGVTFNVPSYYRWCAYYNPLSHSFGACQGRRDWTHYLPNYLGGWISTGAAGVQATASLTINSVSAGQSLTGLSIGGVDVVGGTTFTADGSSTTTSVAQAVCSAIHANTASTGYSCAQTAGTVLIQAAMVGTAANGLEVIASGPPDAAAVNSTGELRVLDATAGYRIDSVLITRGDATTAQLVNSTVTADGSIANTARMICEAINSGPRQGVYIAKSGSPADPLLDWGTCQSTIDGFVGIKRIPADALDNGASITASGPTGASVFPAVPVTVTSGTITVNSTGGATRLSDITLNGTSILSSKPLDYSDGGSTTAIAADIASKISVAGCTATSASNVVSVSGTCSGTLAVAAVGTAATGTFRVATVPGSGTATTNKGALGGIRVGTANVVGAVSSTSIANVSAASTNATTLRGLVGSGFTAAAPVAASGGAYDVTVTAPTGNSYNGLSFTFDPGTTSAGGAGSQPQWVFPITGASADNAALTSITCGGTTAVGARNTGSTTANVNWVQNLAMGYTGHSGFNGQTVAGPGGNYSYSCTNASMGSPAYRCTVTGPAGAPACSNLAITKDATITLSTTSPAAVGGTAASSNSWTLNFTNATKDNRVIDRIRCGPTAGAASTSSGTDTLNDDADTGTSTAPSSYAQNLATSLLGPGGSNFDPDGSAHWTYGGGSSSFCTANAVAGTVSCTFRKTAPACSSPLSITFGTGANAGLTLDSGPTLSGSDWSFTLGGATAANRTVASITCPEAPAVTTAGSATGDGGGSVSAPDLATDIITALNATYWDKTNSSCTGTGDSSSNRQVTCNLKPVAAGICTSTPTVNASGLSIGAVTLVSSKWNFSTVVGTFNTGDGISSITCPSSSTTTYRAVIENNGTTGTLGTTTTQKVQRLENLRNDLNGETRNSFTYSCPTAATDAAGFTCTLSGPSTCTSPTLYVRGSDQSGIYIGGAQVDDTAAQFGAFTAAASATSPTWTFDITNATADNRAITALTCGGTSILPSPVPDTGVSPSDTGYQRINNLTGASAGPPATNGVLGPTNGYTLDCQPATVSAPEPSCTLVGPVGLGACDGSTLTFNKDSSISVGAVSFTDGSAANTAVDDLAPYLSTATPFSIGRAPQGATASGMGGVTTATIPVSTVAMSNGALSSVLAIPTNATGTPPDVLTMGGGQPVDTSTNHWSDVGVFKRVDIVPTNSTYSRSSGRTDCAGSTCTYAEEMQNFANWYSYYRTRMQMMKSATTLAFSQLDGNYRVGYDNICQATGTSVKERVAQFVDSGGETANQRTNWWSNLTTASPSCATPLRAETAKIGRYYAGKLTLSGDPLQYSCQQNFMILVTDGYWNENEPSSTSITGGDVGNTDNVLETSPGLPAGSVARPHYDGAQASTTCPATGTGRGTNFSSCRTLADITNYYYSTDIRSTTFSNKCNGGLGNTCTDGGANDVSVNNVLTNADDKTLTQHMNFFAMGLGIDGVLEYRSDYQTAGTGDYHDIASGSRNWPAVANLDPTGVDDLWHATVNGHGKYFSARNLPNVVAGLREALNKIGARVGSAAAAATSNLRPVSGDNFAYVASYATLDWVGDLQARTINTTTGDVSPSTDCSNPATTNGCTWSAQAKLDDLTWSARRIYIKPVLGTSGDPLRLFTMSNLTGTEASWFNPSSLSQSATISSSNLTAENLVNFLRGNRGMEQDGDVSHDQLWRFRAHVLGDIVDTQPIYNKAPSENYGYGGYAAFKVGTASTRKPVVYVSAQDGMLHAFNAYSAAVTVSGATVQPGDEMWAYIPQKSLENMKVLADVNYTSNHRYFVDGPIAVADVNFGGGDSDWHTILVGGHGPGATSYFALDVTDPLNPLFLWEFSDANLGYAVSNPEVRRLPNGEWAVLFTSGYNNNSGGGDGVGRLYALNPKTGAIKTGYPLSTGSGGATTPSNLGKIEIWPRYPKTRARPDAEAKFVYAGDLNGDLWRFDLDPSANGHSGTSVFKLAYLNRPGCTDPAAPAAHTCGQPITSKPEVTTTIDGSLVAYIGTGKYLETSDLASTDGQSVYAIKDTLGEDNLTAGAGQQTWTPRTDTKSVGGATTDAFLKRRFISVKEDGSAIQYLDEYGNAVPGRALCAIGPNGEQPTVTAAGVCNLGTDAGGHAIVATPMDWSIFGGWMVDLPESGERVNVDPLLHNGTLVVASNVPAATSCTVGGSAFINFLDYATGLGVQGEVIASRKIPDSLVVGITAIVLGDGTSKVIVTKSNYQQESQKIPVAPSTIFQNKRSLWREFEAY